MKFGLIGKKLGHSYSALIHGHFHRITGLKGSYELIEIPEPGNLEERINELSDEGFTGINVTIPYKEDVLALCFGISGETIRIGAANTLIFRKDEILAYNTDYFGFRRTLEIEGISIKEGNWLVLGSGGSSKSVRAVLRDIGASSVLIASRTGKGPDFISYSDIPELGKMAGIINTTPVGMFPDTGVSVVEKDVFSKFDTAIDLIYNPSRTLFLEYAEKSGLKTVNGLLMLVAQAVKAQEIWRNREFSDDLILEIYRLMEEGI